MISPRHAFVRFNNSFHLASRALDWGNTELVPSALTHSYQHSIERHYSRLTDLYPLFAMPTDIKKESSNNAFGGVLQKYSFKSSALGNLETKFNIFLPNESESGRVPVIY